MQKIYLVLKNADSCEGRGPMIPLVGVRTKYQADRLKEGLDKRGYPSHDVQELDFVEVAESYPGFPTRANKMQAALSKLTDEEQVLLGLKPQA